MDFLSREKIIQGLINAMPSIMDKYNLDDIGVYEEEGEGDKYYMGYTIRKNGKVYMINTTYVKNEEKKLAQLHNEWTIQQEEGESKGYQSLENVFDKISEDHVYFEGSVVDIKDNGELDVSNQRGIVEFSEELSDGGERNEIIEEQSEEQ